MQFAHVLCFAHWLQFVHALQPFRLTVLPHVESSPVIMIVVLFAIATLVWSVPLIRRTSLVGFGWTVVVCGTFFGPAFFAIDGPIQISLDRVLLGVLVGVTGLGFLSGRMEWPRLCRVDIAVALFAVWLLVSSQMGTEETEPSLPLSRWIFFVLFPALMYTVARVAPNHPGDIPRILWSLVGMGAYLSVVAVFETKDFHHWVYPRFIVDPIHVEFFGRGRGPLLNPAGNGIVMTIALSAAIALFFRTGRVGKLLLLSITLILLVGIYSTFTRSVWLGGIAACGLVGVLYSPRWLRVFALVGAVGFSGVMVSGLRDEILSLKRDKEVSASDAAKSVSLRPLLALVAFEMFKDKPLAGHGFGHYVDAAADYHTVRSYDLPLEQARPYIQHSVFLSVLVDTGIIGLLTHASILVLFGVMAWRLARDLRSPPEYHLLAVTTLGVQCAYVVNGLFHEVAIIEMVHVYVFFVGGLCVNAWERQNRPAEATKIAAPLRPADHSPISAGARVQAGTGVQV